MNITKRAGEGTYDTHTRSLTHSLPHTLAPAPPHTLGLPELSQEFEAVFLKYLFQEMEKTVPKSDLFSSNWVNGYYQEMLFQNLSEQLAKTGGIGIGQMLSKSLKLKGETANKIN